MPLLDLPPLELPLLDLPPLELPLLELPLLELPLPELPPLELPLLDRAGTAYTKLVLFSYSINKPESPLAPAIKIVEHRGITA